MSEISDNITDTDKEDLLSDNTSDTSYCDDELSENTHQTDGVWKFTNMRYEGRVLVLGEWVSKTKSHRYVVIGPDWPCVIMTYVVICVPSVFVYLYLLHNTVEFIIFFLVLAMTIFGLTSVFLADPGLVRKYHHARTRQWTFCDHCESFRPPGSVHCSTCQVCVAGYDHHCPVSSIIVCDSFFSHFFSSVDWEMCRSGKHRLFQNICDFLILASCAEHCIAHFELNIIGLSCAHNND